MVRHFVLLSDQCKVTIEDFLHSNDSACCAETGLDVTTSGKRMNSESDSSPR